uniref:HMG box domain-containing protein n=1 Tax=Parascaris univalens TaxID=6257 RepID=A0A915A991_PARUN
AHVLCSCARNMSGGMFTLCARFARLSDIAAPLKSLSCYASTSKRKEIALPSGYRKTPPFAFFLKENFIKKDGVKVTEAMIELKNRWNALNAIEKKKYFDESDAELKEKKAKFDALDVEEKQRLREESKRNRETRKRRRIRAEKAAKREKSGRPIRPASAYNLYMKEKMDVTSKVPEKIRERFKECAIAWKTLTEKEKQKYIDEAAILAKKFDEERRIWRENNEKHSTKKIFKETID